MSKELKMVFLMKYVISAYDNSNKDAMIEGMEMLFTLFPTLQKYWKISCKSYSREEGERVNLLFKYAIREKGATPA